MKSFIINRVLTKVGILQVQKTAADKDNVIASDYKRMDVNCHG